MSKPNIGASIKVIKSQIFDGSLGKVLSFIIICRLIRIREGTVKEQIQWILSYVQEELADI